MKKFIFTIASILAVTSVFVACSSENDAINYEELTTIQDIGPTIATNIVDYFKDENNISILTKLKDYNINMTYINDNNIILNDNFNNKTFVLTGTLNSITRDNASTEIENRGGKVTSSVTKKTNIVIVGDNPGSKYDKAINLGIEIWNEEKFIELINKDN